MDSFNSDVFFMNERQGRTWEKVRDKPKGRSKSRDKKKGWKCYKCKQIGHLKRNYPLLKKKKGKGISKRGLAIRDACSYEDSRSDPLVVSDGVSKHDRY